MSKFALAAGMAIVAGVCISAGQAAVGSRVSAQDAHYLQSAIQGDRFEVIGGRIALAQSGSSVVRALGQRLITDH
jgi:hypothetical protein